MQLNKLISTNFIIKTGKGFICESFFKKKTKHVLGTVSEAVSRRHFPLLKNKQTKKNSLSFNPASDYLHPKLHHVPLNSHPDTQISCRVSEILRLTLTSRLSDM